MKPSKSAPAGGRPTSQSTQQLQPRQLPPESQSHPPQQQQQLRPIQPWSVHSLNLLPPTLSKNTPPTGPLPSPFPRHCHSLSATASAAGELFLFGGRAHKFLRNDLYVFSTEDLSANLLKTTGEVPSPRYGHVCARIGDALLIWGGVTNINDQGKSIGPYDDSLYLLNPESREWTRIVVDGPGPVSRFYPAATVVGSKLFVFGGRKNGKALNDMWAFDLNSLKSHSVWNSYEPAPGGEKPPPRSGHVLVATGDRIILFGGAYSQHTSSYNDTWLFDVSTRKWSELQCSGYTPSPRYGHAASFVDDVMYVFGGRVNGLSVDDLLAFKLSTQRWFRFQNIGPSPRRRWLHAMASDGTRVFVLGGELSEISPEDAVLIHVMDTKHTKYPDSDLNNVKPSEETTQLARKSSPSPPTLEEDDDGEGSAEYRAKLGTLEASFEGETAQSELERLLSATLAALTKRDQRLAQPTDELRERVDRLLVQTSLVEQKDAELVDMRARLDELLLSRRSRDQQVSALEQALQEATSRAAEAEERSRRAHEQIVLVEQKDAELDELLLSGRSRDEHVRALEQALQKATSRATDADERSLLACERYETELAAIRLRLTNAENGWAKSEREVDTSRASALITAGFVNTNEDHISDGSVRHIRVMDAETASLRSSGKNSEAIQYCNEG